MTHIAGHDRSQTLLLPEALDDYVGHDNPVRFIDAFVDGLDLAAAGFVRQTPKSTGRPGYAPADLLKLYIYGYLNRVRSSRRLEAETHRNLEVIWLLRHLKPDFKTIADFRRDNHKAFRLIFRQFVVLCRQLDLFGRELIAVDGTRLKAVNNKRRNFTRASLTKYIRLADAKLDDYLQRLDTSDASEATTSGTRVKNLAEKIAVIRERQARCKEMLAELDRTGESQISLTDPDSRAMATHTRVAVGYNAQVAVDAKHQLIVEQQVTNQVADMGLLTPTAEPAKAALGVETIAVVADRGYFKIEDIEACEKAGMEPYALCAALAARVSGQGRLLSQGRIQLRARHRQFSLSGRPAAWRLFVISAAWAEEDQICQPHRLPGLSVAHEMHKELIPLGVTPGERSRPGPAAAVQT